MPRLSHIMRDAEKGQVLDLNLLYRKLLCITAEYVKKFRGSCGEGRAVAKATALQVICYSANIT